MRRMPQWRLEGGTYFVTWRLATTRWELSPDERGIVAGAVTYFKDKRYRLYAYVVMNDHVHVIVTPNTDFSLSSILHSWKSLTAHQILKTRGASGAFWQEDNYTRVVRSEGELFKFAQYILDNPRKRWPDMDAYEWVEVFEFD